MTTTSSKSIEGVNKNILKISLFGIERSFPHPLNVCFLLFMGWCEGRESFYPKMGVAQLHTAHLNCFLRNSLEMPLS